MKNRLVAVAVTALVIGNATGCSSGPAPAKPEPETLPAGTAQLTINGKYVDTTAVQCARNETLTTIKIGHDDASGATAMVSQAEELTVEFVRIHNLNGFTGDYNLGLEGSAAVALTDAAYHISGTALGYSPTSIAPSTEPFTIKVAC